MRIGSTVLALAFAGMFLLPVAAQAQAAPRVQAAPASQSAGTDISAQNRTIPAPTDPDQGLSALQPR